MGSYGPAMRESLDKIMLTTKQYRTLFNTLAKKHGIRTVGTWTDCTTGRGYTIPGQDLRYVTYGIDTDNCDYPALTEFVRELSKHDLMFTSNNVRLTSCYIKATCLIHDDLWHSMDTINA